MQTRILLLAFCFALFLWVDSFGQASDTAIYCVQKLPAKPVKQNYVSVLRAESSLSFEITHLWTGIQYPIIPPSNLIKIWTDNGIIINRPEGWADYIDYCIKPQKNGTVHIYTMHIMNKADGQQDTIKGVSTFKAIPPPKLKVLINYRLLKNNSVLKYDVVFKENLKTIAGTRYQIGALPPEIKVLTDEMEIGEIYVFTDQSEEKELLAKGNRIIFPSLVIRDMKTDLVIFTESFEYKYR